MEDELLDRFNTLLTRVESIAEEVTRISTRLSKIEAQQDLTAAGKIDRDEMKLRMWNDSFEDDGRDVPFGQSSKEEAPLKFLRDEPQWMTGKNYRMPGGY
jgi:hypothetical protein